MSSSTATRLARSALPYVAPAIAALPLASFADTTPFHDSSVPGLNALTGFGAYSVGCDLSTVYDNLSIAGSTIEECLYRDEEKPFAERTACRIRRHHHRRECGGQGPREGTFCGGRHHGRADPLESDTGSRAS